MRSSFAFDIGALHTYASLVGESRASARGEAPFQRISSNFMRFAAVHRAWRNPGASRCVRCGVKVMPPSQRLRVRQLFRLSGETSWRILGLACVHVFDLRQQCSDRSDSGLSRTAAERRRRCDERITFTTHNGTHLDAPAFSHTMDGGKRHEVRRDPLEWCFSSA